ncbi:MAG TPA: chemotaxis protein CheW [bacterium]
MGKNLHIVVFSLGKELYGLGIDSVHEIVRVPDITSLPDSPVFLEGVINLRGKIISVIDLRKRFRLEGTAEITAAKILVIENEGNKIGILVDSVAEVLKIQPDAVEKPPEIVSAIGIDYIKGVIKVEEKLIIILEIKKILSVEEMKKLGNNIKMENKPDGPKMEAR